MRTPKDFLGRAKIFLLELAGLVLLAMVITKIIITEWTVLFH
jgi:hypothetical protein